MLPFYLLEDVLDFLAVNRNYPKIHKNGKLFFSKKMKDLHPEEIEKMKNLLQIKNQKDCELIRKKIKSRVDKWFPCHSIQQWQSSERPRERLLEAGPESLSNAQLLAVLLRTGIEGLNAQDLAKELLLQYQSLRLLNQASTEELKKIHGLGPAKIAQLKAAMEIGRRCSVETLPKFPRLINTDKVKEYIERTLHWSLRDSKKEKFAIVFLDAKLKPITHCISTIGTNKESIVDIPDIIRKASQTNASSLILIHNHPSGETDPSPEDIDTTRRIIQACQLVGIYVLDHVIIGTNPEDMFSFANQKLI